MPINPVAVIHAFIICVFIVNPLVGVMFGATYTWNKRSLCPSDMFLLTVLGAAYLGLINTTKIPDSDFSVYLDWYSMAADTSLLEYLALFTREPLFFTWMYFVSNLTSGSESAFVFLSTLFAYVLVLINTVRIGKYFSLGNRAIILVIICFIYFGPLFSLSAHLMRQFLAAALVLTFYTTWIVSSKRPWWILIVALFVHYSAALFIVFAAMKVPQRLSVSLSLMLATVSLAVVFMLSKLVANSFSSVPVFGLIFSRIVNEEGADIGHLSLMAIVFVISIALFSIAGQRSNLISKSKGLSNLYAAVIFLALIVLIANLSDETVEVAKRFYFYEYFLAAIVFPLFLYVANWTKLVLTLLPFVFIPHFFVTIEFGAWQYANLTRLLFLPSWEIWGR
jgi:hypothetical protein